jgi:glucose-6-phosphate dehydrogenase-like protein
MRTQFKCPPTIGRSQSQYESVTEMESSPTIVVIFGGAGDLAWRKVMPSLFDLYRKGLMPALVKASGS